VAGVPPALVVVQPTRLPPQKNGEGGEKVQAVESRELRVERSKRFFSVSQLSKLSTLSKARSQNICPFHLIRVAACADGPEKLLREKEE
jgi:hypothetical protein